MRVAGMRDVEGNGVCGWAYHTECCATAYRKPLAYFARINRSFSGAAMGACGACHALRHAQHLSCAAAQHASVVGAGAY